MHEVHGYGVIGTGEPLNPPEASAAGDAAPQSFPGTESHEEIPPRPAGPQPKGDSKARLAARAMLSWDVRFKVAVVVSFLILVVVLVANRSRGTNKADAKVKRSIPPARIASGEVPPVPPKDPSKDTVLKAIAGSKPSLPEVVPPKKKAELAPEGPPEIAEGARTDEGDGRPLLPSDAEVIHKTSVDQAATGKTRQGEKEVTPPTPAAPPAEAPAKDEIFPPTPVATPPARESPADLDATPHPDSQGAKSSGGTTPRESPPAAPKEADVFEKLDPESSPPASPVSDPPPLALQPKNSAGEAPKDPPIVPPMENPSADPATKPPLKLIAPPAAEPPAGGLYPIPLAGNTRATPPARAVAPPEAVGEANMVGMASAATIDPGMHVVRRGENFWSIAKFYYGSGRSYMALWDANKDQFAAPEDLYVGAKIRVPAPEDLRRDLVAPARKISDEKSATTDARGSGQGDSTKDPLTKQASRKDRGSVLLPAADTTSDMPRGDLSVRRGGTDTTAARPPRSYTVKKSNETLRTIAHAELGDSDRDGEILKLNEDLLDDRTLKVGMKLRLPEDSTRR